jgi:hypothetical protein
LGQLLALVFVKGNHLGTAGSIKLKNICISSCCPITQEPVVLQQLASKTKNKKNMVNPVSYSRVVATQ